MDVWDVFYYKHVAPLELADDDAQPNETLSAPHQTQRTQRSVNVGPHLTVA